MFSKKQQQFLTVFLIFTLLFSCGWSDAGAFLAGCLTGALLTHALDHHHTTAVVYERSPSYEVFTCHRCSYRYTIVQGTRQHTCPRCHLVYRWRD